MYGHTKNKNNKVTYLTVHLTKGSVESPTVNSSYFVELNSILYPFTFRVCALKRFAESRQSQAKPDGVPMGWGGGTTEAAGKVRKRSFVYLRSPFETVTSLEDFSKGCKEYFSLIIIV